MFGVFLPAILKSWAILPRLITVKITVPVAGIRFFESLNLNSVMVTVIREVASELCGAATASVLLAKLPVANPATARTASTQTPMTRRICKKNPSRKSLRSDSSRKQVSTGSCAHKQL